MEATHHLDEIDPTFVADLLESVDFVWLAARWISKKWGCKVLIPPTFVRPNPAERYEYADDGDLEITKRIEVKHRPKIHFTGSDDFRYETIIVDVAHSWDRAHPKPEAYLIFDKDASHCALISASTRKHWKKENKPFHGRKQDVYVCPLDKVQWWEVDIEKSGP